MRVSTISCLFFSAAVACGGTAVVDKATVGSESTGGAGAGGGSANLRPNDQIQSVDDVDHAGGQYPPVPPGSSAFFWRGGLGNWFVTSSDGSSRDAPIDDVIPPRGDSHKAYHVTETAPGVGIDLWAQLNHPQGSGVDLSPYVAMSFWARMDSPGSKLTVAFGSNGQISSVISTPSSVPQKVVSLSEVWAQFVVRFDEVGLKPKSVSSIDFVASGTGSIGLWVDDLGFLCQGTCP